MNRLFVSNQKEDLKSKVAGNCWTSDRDIKEILWW